MVISIHPEKKGFIPSLLNPRGEPRWGELSWHSTGKPRQRRRGEAISSRATLASLSFLHRFTSRFPPGIDPLPARCFLKRYRSSTAIYSSAAYAITARVPRGYAGTRQLVPRSNVSITVEEISSRNERNESIIYIEVK